MVSLTKLSKMQLANKGINTIFNGTLFNFGKRYDNNLSIKFDQWLKLDLGLGVLRNQKVLKGI